MRRLAVVLGGAVVVVTITVVAVFAQRYQDAEQRETDSRATDSEPVETQTVVVTPARRMQFEQRLEVAGNVLAKNFALVSAKIPGTLDDVFVDEGDFVEAGKTPLFQTDSLKLEKALSIAQEQVTVAECAVREKEALLEKTMVGLEQAKADLKRYQRLHEQSAVSQQNVEHQQAQVRSLEADVRHVETLIALAKAQLEQARLNLRIAEKDLEDSLVKAPITGRVSVRFQEPGEMADPGKPVVKIDSLDQLEVSVFVPSEYYPQVTPGETKLRVRSGNLDLGELTTSYKSPTVDSKLRTFELKCLVDSPPGEVVPGCLAEVTVVFAVREGIGVPDGAILRRAGGEVVFAVAEGTAKMRQVQTGWEQDGWREIRSGISEQTPVVTMGQSHLEDGTPVQVHSESEEEAASS